MWAHFCSILIFNYHCDSDFLVDKNNIFSYYSHYFWNYYEIFKIINLMKITLTAHLINFTFSVAFNHAWEND